jgi:hypothetical protein
METFEASHRSYLVRLCGNVHIPLDDSFWLELARYPASLSAIEPSLLYSFLEPYATQLARHNAETGHFATLVTHTIDGIGAASSSRARPQEILCASNAVVILQCFLVALLRTIPPAAQKPTLFVSPHHEVTQDVLCQLISTCLVYVVEGEVTQQSYCLHHACLNLLSACCCSSLYHVDAHVPGMCSLPA